MCIHICRAMVPSNPILMPSLVFYVDRSSLHQFIIKLCSKDEALHRHASATSWTHVGRTTTSSCISKDEPLASLNRASRITYAMNRQVRNFVLGQVAVAAFASVPIKLAFCQRWKAVENGFMPGSLLHFLSFIDVVLEMVLCPSDTCMFAELASTYKHPIIVVE